jgi:hypothetical protein
MEILKKEWFYTLPLVIITIFMLSGYSPGYSAILGLATCIIVSYKYQGDPHRLYPGRGHGPGPGHADDIGCSARPWGPRRAGASTTCFPKRPWCSRYRSMRFWYAIKKEHRPAIQPG